VTLAPASGRRRSDAQAVSPIVMNTRRHDQNEDIALLRTLIYEIYSELGYTSRREAGKEG
jgi:hypothetical protein